jgi:hypothetical protein
MEGCQLTGMTGMHVPVTKTAATRLTLLQCTLHSARMGLAAVMMLAGLLRMEDCSVHNNSIALEICPGCAPRAHLRHPFPPVHRRDRLRPATGGLQPLPWMQIASRQQHGPHTAGSAVSCSVRSFV